jgi:hypothetical protein
LNRRKASGDVFNLLNYPARQEDGHIVLYVAPLTPSTGAAGEHQLDDPVFTEMDVSVPITTPRNRVSGK